MSRPRRHAGFSLAETLVALAIFTLAVAVLGAAANNALNAMRIMEITEGHEQDYAAVRKTVLVIPDKETFETGGDVETPTGGRASWSAVVTPTTTLDLFRVDLTVKIPPTAEMPGEETTRAYYLLRPAWSDPVDRDTILGQRKEALAGVRTYQAWP